MHFITSKLKRFDIHRKTVDSVNDQTISGALITILSSFIIFILVYSSILEYYSPEEINHMIPDYSVGFEEVQINFRVVFTNVPCKGIFK